MGPRSKEAKPAGDKEKSPKNAKSKANMKSKPMQQNKKPAGGKAGKKLSTVAQSGNKGKKKSQLPHEGNVYEFDEEEEAGGERRKKDELKRFAGVEVYEYEQPENFEDDEEIDEDDAFNEDDLEMYGDIGGGSAKYGKFSKGKKQADGSDESGGDDEDEGGEGGEGDELDGIFQESGEEDEDDDDEDYDDEEEEDDEIEAEKYNKMVAAVKTKPTGVEEDGAFQETASGENEFAVAAGSHGIRAAGKLSLGSLLASVKGGKGMGGMVKVLEKLKTSKPVPVPVPLSVATRAARETGYEETSKVVTEWQPVVKQNREKEQVKFPLKEPGRFNVSSSSLAASFKPRTTLEEEIQAQLKAGGADEETLKKTEELELRKLSVEEVKQRQAELASMRSLLFHAEIRAKRINKIKSKKFRKVDRKYKDKAETLELSQLKDVDPEEYKKRVMTAERKRAEERVSLKHKNTSKWVKHMLARGHGEEEANDGTREAIAEQLRLGEELRKKQIDASDNDESGSEGDIEGLKNEIEAGPLAGLSEDAKERAKKGVYGMAFMQRAEVRNKEQALAQLKELEAMERGEGLSDDSDVDQDESVGAKRKQAPDEADDHEGYEQGSDDDEQVRHNHAQSKPAKSNKKQAKGEKAKRAPLRDADKKVLQDGGLSLDQVVFGGGNATAVGGFTTVYEASVPAVQAAAAANKAGKGKGKAAGGANSAAAATAAPSTRASKAAATAAAAQKGGVNATKGTVGVTKGDTNATNGGVVAPQKKVAGKRKKGDETADHAAGDGDHGDEGGAKDNAVAAAAAAGDNPWLVPAERKTKLQEVANKGGKVQAEGTKQHEHVAKLRKKGEAGADAALLDTSARLGGTLGVGAFGLGVGGEEGQREGDEGEVSVMMAEPSAEQKKLMRTAFVDADVEKEFRDEKEQILDAAKPKVVAATPGWGGWGGDGVREWEKAKKVLEVSHKRTKQEKLNALMNADVDPSKRKDKNLDHVIITERRNRKASKYLVEKQPYQFSSKEQYEQAMRQPVGPDWNTQLMHKKAIAKKVVVKVGTMIDPIQKPSSKRCKANMLAKVHAARPERPTQ